MSMTDITISPGSVVDFSWTGVHNVVLCADEASYDACSCSDQVAAIAPNGAYAWDSTGTTGTAYFICSVGNHCVQGQKIAITVKSEAASSPPPAGAAKCSDTCIANYEGCVGASGNAALCRQQVESGAGSWSSCTPGCTITSSPPPAAAAVSASPPPASVPCEDTEDADFCSKKVEKGSCSKFLDVCAVTCGACTPETAGVSEDCVDTESAAYCSKKVEKGSCDKFLDVCAVSCGACTPADAAVSPPPAFSGPCVDSDAAFCSKKVEKGSCDKFLEDCPASCGICTPDDAASPPPAWSGPCVDSDAAFCSKKVDKGVCDKFLEDCPASCGVCVPDATDASPPPSGPCVDEKGTKKCEKKADKWCAKAKKAKLCAATCGLCEVVCADVETEKKCSKYLSKGQCSSKKKAEACPLTCGSCTP